LAEHQAEAIGLRLLAADIAARARRHCEGFGLGDDPAVARALADMEASQSVARGARAARLMRLEPPPPPGPLPQGEGVGEGLKQRGDIVSLRDP
jgi:hypothetical protein